MESYLASAHFDLVTPDGVIQKISGRKASVLIEGISPAFVGYDIDRSLISFNLKSALAQIGVDATMTGLQLNRSRAVAEVELELFGIAELAKKMLPLLQPGAHIGKLFAADDRRRVRNPHYLTRMFGRSDRFGNPLLSLGGLEGSSAMVL